METYCYIALIFIVCSAIGSYLVMHKTKPTTYCEHKNTGTYVESVSGTCETTKVTCLDCGKVLKNETDCR